MGRGAESLGRVFLGLVMIWAAAAGAVQPAEEVWVFLRDKADGVGGRLAWGGEPGPEALDLPVDAAYLDYLRRNSVEIRVVSRWLNAVSLCVTPAQRLVLERADMVVSLKPLRRWRATVPAASVPTAAKAVQDETFGLSFEQLAQIGVTEMHRAGYRGAGMRIAVLDNGFELGGHVAFAGLKVVASRDFVNGDDVVGDQDSQPVTGDESRSQQNIHGAQVLAVLAADAPGQYIGAAPEAEYLLAKTENNSSELPIEEDLWVAGLEWADSLGADVVNTSLGYNTFDDGSGYTHEDIDGQTAVTSRAAAAAVRRGMVLVVAAGNEGNVAWRRVTMPADVDGVISVGAVDRFRVVASTSSRGPTADGRIKPDVVAPGVNVWTADVRGGAYQRIDGTSFAAPMVSGVCALLLQMNPDWGAADILEALRSTAADLGQEGPDNDYGWGQVDAWRAGGGGDKPLRDQALVPFPNPVAESVFFPLLLLQRGEVELRVFDIAGGLVFEDSPRFFEAGSHLGRQRALHWVLPPGLADGVYFYEVRAAAFRTRGKIAVVRGS
jgi:serine protease AprX